VRDVSLKLASGKVLGLIGESGSGKTTLVRAISGLVEPVAGSIHLKEILLKRLSKRNIPILRSVQVIFQNPDQTLNPYRSIGFSLLRPLKRLVNRRNPQNQPEMTSLLSRVGLSSEYASRLPASLSGGEKQRVAIARAIAPGPDVLLADEPVSALDVSLQSSIINLLNQLQKDSHFGMVFISHDIALVSYLADEYAIIYQGNIVEYGSIDLLFTPPHHPYTRQLLSAMLIPGRIAHSRQVDQELITPNVANTTGGCLFSNLCALNLGDKCQVQFPPWQRTSNGKSILCHLPLPELIDQQGESKVI
jgi:peptide/nickel transport system ATP-binding protein